MIGKCTKVEPNFDYYKVLPGQGKYFDTEFRVQGDKPWPKTLSLKGRTSFRRMAFITGLNNLTKNCFISHLFKALRLF